MKTTLFLAGLALASLATPAFADEPADRAEARGKQDAPTGSRIQRLPDITVIPGSISRGGTAAHRTERRPARVDEEAFLAGTD